MVHRYFRRCKVVKALLTTIIIIITLNYYFLLTENMFISKEMIETNDFQNGEWRNLKKEQIQNLSNLGRILYLNEKPPPIKIRLTPYKILVWKHGLTLALRHIRNQSSPFRSCSVQNCELTYDSNKINTADLVLFHLHHTQSVKELPTRTSVTQIWTFFSDESPYNAFSYPQRNGIKPYNGIFNWSMSYRMNSDIPVPYGRTLPLKTNVDKINITKWNLNKRQDVLAAIMISNCGVKKRLMYVKELSKHIQVDVYGDCGNLTCPGHYYTDCEAIYKYKFFLSFENSNCEEYITEKVWWHGYNKNTIPVVMGAPKLSLQQCLPPNSYIDVNDFPSPGHLAKYLLGLNSSLSALENFFEWKRNFKVLNEHGYVNAPSAHYCRICEALNYNSKKTKIYKNFDKFFDSKSCK